MGRDAEVDLINSQSFQFIVTDGDRGDHYFVRDTMRR